ncbi:MAG TPA: lipid A biosynthesis lauroyl acyltransferase [Rhizobiales bacterium]|nr:lipid A biosynthesis lauroyl acyltransferase [Hyphomicrobiales bacterium]
MPLKARLAQRLKMANYWVIAQGARLAFWLLRMLPADRALAFADRFARRWGPWFGRHRVAVGNLRAAFPEKSEAEIEKIASDMWGNMGRLAAEYVFLDKLLDYDPESDLVGRVEIGGRETFDRIASEDRPHILFTGHLGNFELLPICGRQFGLKLTSMFRPPNNPYIAEYIARTRKATMGELLPSRAGAAIALARLIDEGQNVGMLVDQKFSNGIRTTFFGRVCETSPLLPRLARRFDCDVYPAYSIRLPGNRFRLVLEEKLDLPRDADGLVDVERTAQMLNDTVERWIRQDPGQWMWFHKRWSLGTGRRRAGAAAQRP